MNFHAVGGSSPPSTLLRKTGKGRSKMYQIWISSSLLAVSGDREYACMAQEVICPHQKRYWQSHNKSRFKFKFCLDSISSQILYPWLLEDICTGPSAPLWQGHPRWIPAETSEVNWSHWGTPQVIRGMTIFVVKPMGPPRSNCRFEAGLETTKRLSNLSMATVSWGTYEWFVVGIAKRVVNVNQWLVGIV